MRSRSGGLASVAVVQITGTDPDGDALARPLVWEDAGPPPQILMAPEPHGHPALAPGQRVLARLRPAGPGRYEGRTLKRLEDSPGRIIGVFRPADAARRRDARITPTDRRSKAEWTVPPAATLGAEANEIVLAEPLPHHGLGLKPARVLERLGALADARAVSLIVIAGNDIPHVFPAEAETEAAAARAARLGRRTDLRALALVTIDGADARDFDDAVFAEPTAAGGFRLIVAIADVAHYVRPGSALDRTARERGNSVYFPDRVVPMLPEALSNGWCSLRPQEDRPCLFAELAIDAAGRKTAHHFGRGLMRSVACLTYEQVQQAEDGIIPLDPPAGAQIPVLYAAFRALLAARTARGTLDLDLPERQVILHPDGSVADVIARPRRDSHRLIEEFMIAANVAAAEELGRVQAPCLYRVHAPPSAEKLEELRSVLHGLGLSLPPGDQLHPRDLDRVLRRITGRPEAPLVNEVVLRSQSQAAYSPDNIGHFGLALRQYAHFTSPIRRYADLLVHRALIRALRLGPDGLAPDAGAEFSDVAAHITATERRAQTAEREAIDRYLTAFLADRVGAVFAARVSGVTRFGLFVTLTENGASGIVPRSALPDDFWQHDAREQSLTGRRTGLVFRLGAAVEVRLAEATPITGGLVFHPMQGVPPRPSFRGGQSGYRSRRR